MQSGKLTVVGKNSSSILLAGWPREIIVRFKPEHDPIPCNHHHHDKLKYEIVKEDEDMHEHLKIVHTHRNRQFYLVISWEVASIREIDWFILY